MTLPATPAGPHHQWAVLQQEVPVVERSLRVSSAITVAYVRWIGNRALDWVFVRRVAPIAAKSSPRCGEA